jgi:hypothetical protein
MPKAKIDGCLVAPMVTGGGIETILGVANDPVFGPVVMFGLGGVLVEALGDVSLRVAPFEEAEAHKQAAKIQGVNRRYVTQAASVIKHGTPELQEAVAQGEIGVQAADIVSRRFNTLSQKQLLAEGAKAVTAAGQPAPKEPLEHAHLLIEALSWLPTAKAHKIAKQGI